jgi:2-polyprenyl-6-hydroxyphenyl methylase/3-demethylubiquinone-9 3-methyltransferase
MFGPYEHGVAELYRRIFVNLDDFAEIMRDSVPSASRILEVGCGEGAMTERIARAYPRASITAIDITPKAGRLFRGDKSRVDFRQEDVESLADREPGCFDLVVLADVMHHVPLNLRPSILGAIDRAMTPGGTLIFKDWLITPSPIHWLCNFADTRLTGDNVSYFTPAGIDAMLTDAFGIGAYHPAGAVSPWRNNVVFVVKRPFPAPTK